MAFVSPSITAPTTALNEEKLEALVRRSFNVDLSLVAMPGGASTRRYFRVALPEGKSAVAMFVPEGGKPEEVQKEHDGARWPFLEVRDLLAEHGIDVPDVLAEDTAHGWLVIEDLGDETLANWLVKHPEDRELLYKKAVCDLARAQNELASLPEGCVVASRTFDFDLLRWEIEHFREWGLDARDKSLAPADNVRFSEIADRLAKRVAELPNGFVHRDYQSRNIMVVPAHTPGHRPNNHSGGPRDRPTPRLVWIDFQDALLGPRVYDLVALLNDSYQEFDRSFVEARLGEYADTAALSRGFSQESRLRLLDEFDLVTVQRKLKDAGRFVFIDRQKGNPSFLKFVTPTIKKVGGALARLAPHDEDMRELLEILRRRVGDEIA
jgi:aminoglycoside/choline kinase family phosphotransferase